MSSSRQLQYFHPAVWTTRFYVHVETLMSLMTAMLMTHDSPMRRCISISNTTMMWTVKRNKYAGPFQTDTHVLRVQLFQMKLFSFPLWEDLHYGDATAGIMKIHNDVCVTCTCHVHVHVPGETAGSSWISTSSSVSVCSRKAFFLPFHTPILIGDSPAVTQRGGCKEGLRRTHGWWLPGTDRALKGNGDRTQPSSDPFRKDTFGVL